VEGLALLFFYRICKANTVFYILVHVFIKIQITAYLWYLVQLLWMKYMKLERIVLMRQIAYSQTGKEMVLQFK